jgi:beta-1,4-mannosyltransferase
VLVVGDLGRSPRMLYHSNSLALAGYDVSVVGLAGAEIHADLKSPNLKYHRLPSFPTVKFGGLPMRLLLLPIKALYLMFGILYLLFSLGRLDALLVQTPPAIPALPIAIFVTWWWSARLILDWHNLGFTLFELSLRKGNAVVNFDHLHPLAKLYRAVERWASTRKSTEHLSVTHALARYLSEQWGVRESAVHVLHDRPAPLFQPAASAAVRTALLQRVASSAPRPLSDALTALANDFAAARLVVSATSWTADEDFGVLLDALVQLDKAAASLPADKRPPRLEVVVTGRGDLRAHFESRISSLGLVNTRVHTAWLQPEDYPRLLAAADLGVSLHQSSSGIDLPMKVLDMFGAGVPALARNFKWCAALVSLLLSSHFYS